MDLILLKGIGYGCDYTIGCNMRWEFVKEATDECLEEIYHAYGGKDGVSEMTVVSFNKKVDVDLSKFENDDDFVRGCSHAETEENFCAKCGAPMWREI